MLGKLNKFGVVFLIAFFSFIGGVVGGGLSQSYIGIGNAKTPLKFQNATFDRVFANEVVARKMLTHNVNILDSNFKTVGEFFFNKGEGASLRLNIANKGPRVMIASTKMSSGIDLYDVDRDRRISIGVSKRDPSLDFLYNGISRLTMGTNSVVTKSTGDRHDIKGSVYTYDINRDVTGSLPR